MRFYDYFHLEKYNAVMSCVGFDVDTRLVIGWWVALLFDA